MYVHICVYIYIYIWFVVDKMLNMLKQHNQVVKTTETRQKEIRTKLKYISNPTCVIN